MYMSARVPASRAAHPSGTRVAVPVTLYVATEGAEPSWATFLKQPAEHPQQGGLWVLTAMWLAEGRRYTLTGFQRPTLMDHALLGLGTWRPHALTYLA